MKQAGRDQKCTIGTLEDVVESLNFDIELAEKEKTNLESNNTSLESELQKAEQKCESLRQELETLKNEVALDKNNSAMQSLEEELSKLRSSHEGLLSDKQQSESQVEDAQKQVIDLNSQIVDLTQEVASQRSATQNLELKLSTLEPEFAFAQSLIEKKEVEIQSLLLKEKTFAGKTVELEHLVSSLREDVGAEQGWLNLYFF